ncbi:hypothetical protein D8674_017707 [Pyrus ussuriensis x Pyrus communis]|uniref:Uncharacterized protein n=1 Tax=Pyrus ussuriensis x Pyrus communis TaxID=2448454 RepID=A0A5N5HGM7_9ROSA|nr:hypothetical protein D8674_017707 [Pyrus ussuriensis x Pyrus communis]
MIGWRKSKGFSTSKAGRVGQRCYRVMATSGVDELVPWAVMKKVFSIVKWPPELALEELELNAVPFWTQIRGIPLGLASVENVQRVIKEAGEFIAMEDPGHARGFVRLIRRSHYLRDAGFEGSQIRKPGWNFGTNGFKISATSVDGLGISIQNAPLRCLEKGRWRMASGLRRRR